MQVVAVGGTGFIGRRLCAALLAAGHDVTALSRTPAPDALPAAVETAVGDVTDYASIAPAFAGADAVVNLVALSPLFEPPGGNERHDTVHRGGTERCLRAATAAGVERFVQLSALGADPSGRTHYLRAKGRAERAVRDSSLAWTVLRPSVVFGTGGEFLSVVRRLTPPAVAPLPGGGQTRFQPLWVGDAAELIAEALAHEHTGRVYEIGGPETLTLAEIVRTVRGVDGHTPVIVPVPMAVAGFGLTLAELLPGLPLGRDQYRALQLDATATDADVRTLGLAPGELTTVVTYLRGDRPTAVRQS